MINAEKLLGKVLSEVTKSHSSQKKKQKKQKKKYKQKHRSDDLISGLASKLMSGKGLLTDVGLGVGAYTILKGNNVSGQQVPPSLQEANGIPLAQASSAPPLPSHASVFAAPAVPPIPPAFSADSRNDTREENEHSSEVPTGGGQEEQDLALRMIQVMIAAAYADGKLDMVEEKEILSRLRKANLDNEEKGYILSQFHSPKSIEYLTAGIDDPHVCQAMYSLAVSSIVIDRKEERQWLDDLSHALGLSNEMQAFIEE